MNRRSSRLAVVAVLALASTACSDNEPWEYDLGVDADLTAVSRTTDGFIAVGTSGTVVTWSKDKPAFKPRFVRVTDLGDEDLRAVGHSRATKDRLVVGDGGVAALSSDFGVSWVPLDLGVERARNPFPPWTRLHLIRACLAGTS